MSCWCCGMAVESPKDAEYPTCPACEAGLLELCQPLPDYVLPAGQPMDPDALRLCVADLFADEVRRAVFKKIHVTEGRVWVDPELGHIGPQIQRIARYVRKVNEGG